jgi:5-methylcytosine-specific restriction endonuclease McrA
MSDKLKEKHRLGMLGKNAGETSNFWKGGISKDKEYQSCLRAMHKAKRRALKKSASGKFTAKEWKDRKKEYGNACAACGVEEREMVLAADHIIPLSKGGSNWIWNIQPLCGPCNTRKNNRMPRQLSLVI